MTKWPTIEWLASRTDNADASVPREEAVAVVDELRTADRIREILGPEVEPDPDECRRCHRLMLTRDGQDPTPECDTCAHELLSKMRAALSRKKGNGR